jgi:PAS domain-containing protein
MAATMEYRYEALAQQSDALQIIFESLPWGVIVADLEGRVLFSNPAAEKILRIGNVEVLPDTHIALEGWYLPDQVSVVPPDQLPLVRAIRGEKIVDELIFVRNSQPSPGIWIRVNAWPLKDSAGMVSGGVVMFHDFTQGRNALQSFVLLSRVVEQTADSVVLTDTQGIIQYVNPAFEATTGYSRDEALGKTPRILKSGLHDAEFYRQMWAQFTHGLAFKGMGLIAKKPANSSGLSKPSRPRVTNLAISLTLFPSHKTSPNLGKSRSRHSSCNSRAMFSSASMPPHPLYQASTLVVRRIPLTKLAVTISISSLWRMARF